MRTIVCNTGPPLHLSEAGAIDLLSLAGDILIPPLVAVEFETNAQGWHPPQWVKTLNLEKSTWQKAEKWVKTSQIDAGEAEAIGLAIQVHADWLLTDDAKARQFAKAKELEVHGSIGILLWSVAIGHIREKVLAFQLLNNLANSSLWVSEHVLQEAQKVVTSMCE